MLVEERLAAIAADLRSGSVVQPVTAREFLSWFDAQRRGYWIVQAIRRHLGLSGLQTNPDFEAVYIDAPITFELVGGATVSPPSTESGSALGDISVLTTDPAIYDDPTYRLSKLGAANLVPTYVAPNSSLSVVATIMMSNDFSQLPVMTSERDVKGVVSWASIGARLAFGQSAAEAKDCMEGHREISIEASLFEAIPIIVEHQYVLVRGLDKRIAGIVTASDLSLQFQQLTEPFLLLGEIENHVRRLMDGKFSKIELTEASDPAERGKAIDGVSDLTFGGYIRILEDPNRWIKVGLAIDRSTFCAQLDKVRLIRNDVMHFDPDGIPNSDLVELRKFAQFLRRLQSSGIS